MTFWLAIIIIVALASAVIVDAASISRQCDINDEDKVFQWYDLYQYKGTAQAYKPNAPQSTSICRKPLPRSSPIQIKLRINLWSCTLYESNSNQNCQNVLMSDNTAQHNFTLEIWQPHSDGTYSSLSKKKNDYDCRTKIVIPKPSEKDVSFLELDTFAPGSTGALGGLGPSGLDFPPYGTPVVHFLILDHSHRHLPLLVNVPIQFHARTLEHVTLSRFWPDWRGAAWTTPRDRCPSQHGSTTPLEIRSWEPNVTATSKRITIDLDFYLMQMKDTINAKPSHKWLCRSERFSPQSFFLEPMSLCSAWLLDFFAI